MEIGTFLSLSASSNQDNACVQLVGTGATIRMAIVPSGFDDTNPDDVTKFEELADVIAAAFVDTEPYASNINRFSISRVDDYRGRDIVEDEVWYNPLLIAAASACDYNQIIAIGHNSGFAGGAPGFFSAVGSGLPPSCDPVTCTGDGCPWWTTSCSFDEEIAYTALHETGHTFAGLRHTCWVSGGELQILEAFERISGTRPGDEDPINCGIQFPGSQDMPCTEWDNEDFLSWVMPDDPNFGCYVGCGHKLEWYRPWYTSVSIMCRDSQLENGFTPVDRKLLTDVLWEPTPAPTGFSLYLPLIMP